MSHLCELMGLDHQATSAYHPQLNAQAESYNKTMIRCLNSMLENEQTLDWEEPFAGHGDGLQLPCSESDSGITLFSDLFALSWIAFF